MNKLLNLILTLSCLEFARCENESSEFFRQDLVQITPDDPEVIHSVNDSRIISCSGIDIKWRNPWGKYVTNLSGRVHVADFSTPNDEIHVLRLVFLKILKKDFGKWTCEGTYGEKSFNMIILEPIEFRNYKTEIVVQENEIGVVLPCVAEGQPKPLIHWSHKGHAIPESIHFKKVQDGLWIDSINRSHAGSYTCKAMQNTSQFIEIKDRILYVDVQYKPEIVYSDQMKAINGKVYDISGKRIKYGFINGTIDLLCEAIGNPMPNISWYHNHRKISHHLAETHNGTSNLTITLHHNESFGDYKCRAKNDLGHEDFIVTVERGMKPLKPETFFLVGTGTDVLDVNLGTNEEILDDPMKVTKYRFEMMLKDDFIENFEEWKNPIILDVPARVNVTYLIGNLRSNSTYMVRVASLNAAGLSEWTETKEFTTLEKVPNKNNSNSSKMTLVPIYLLILTIIFQYHHIICN